MEEVKALEDEVIAQKARVGEMSAAIDVMSSGREGGDVKVMQFTLGLDFG